MSIDLVCSEGEYTKASNKTQRYAAFLKNQLERYIAILTASGIVSESVGNSQEALIANARTIASSLDSVTSSFASILTKQAADLEEIDDFQYPDLHMDDVVALLAAFL